MRLFSEDKEFMVRTINNHTIIKIRAGKYNHGILWNPEISMVSLVHLFSDNLLW